MVIVDTDVLIDAVQSGREPAAASVKELVQAGELAVSALTVYELTQDAAEMAASLNRYPEQRCLEL